MIKIGRVAGTWVRSDDGDVGKFIELLGRYGLRKARRSNDS
jgi:hypothetical protein